jgi:hypothetical protein
MGVVVCKKVYSNTAQTMPVKGLDLKAALSQVAGKRYSNVKQRLPECYLMMSGRRIYTFKKSNCCKELENTYSNSYSESFTQPPREEFT